MGATITVSSSFDALRTVARALPIFTRFWAGLVLKPLPWMRSTDPLYPWFGVTARTDGVATPAYWIVQGPVHTPLISASV